MQRVDLDVLDVSVQPGEFSSEDDLRFTWSVEEFTSTRMNLQLEFSKPQSVSVTTDKEVLRIVFKSEYYF